MVKPTVISEEPTSMAEVKKNLADIKKRDGELNFRANKAEEYLNDFVHIKADEAQQLKKKLEGLKISRLKEDQIIKIIDLLPDTADDLKIILYGYTLSLSKTDMEQVIDVIKGFK
jgi:DNA-directed RNA polymerase subunit F